MKFLSWLIVPCFSFMCAGCSGNDLDGSVDELFAEYMSVKVGDSASSDKYFAHFEKAELQELKERSFFPTRSLIITVINLSESFDVDKGKLYRLIGLLIEKGEPAVELDSSKCNFVDQLVMKADVQLFRYLLSKGLRVPKERSCTIDTLEKYKFRYDENSYNTMLEELSKLI